MRGNIWKRYVVRHPYIADWNKIGDYRQRQTDLTTKRENNSQIDYDYKVGGKVLARKDGILHLVIENYLHTQ